MPLSWNEIRQNAIRFSREWAEEGREVAEAKSFWDEFFGVFGVRRRLLATFEEPVRKISGQYGYIDLFWPGTMLAEHKSRGKSLDEAESQAFSYIRDLAREQRIEELPRFVILSDFERIALYDLEPEDQPNLTPFEPRHYYKNEFPLKELHKHLHDFAFIAGYRQHRLRDEDPINIRAVEILGDLHDALAAGGYTGHDLERFLVRILFCLFADDTGLFEPDSFKLFIENRTAADGSDLGLHLAQLFEVLNTPIKNRQAHLDEMLAAFPYVNGELFKERLAFAAFNRAMRDALMRCTEFDWSAISPAIFGSLFQGVMDPAERRQTGGHYTSERDILKVVNALFMDDLRKEFEFARRSKSLLRQFHRKIGTLRFLDPACGCGNFLVITYRELRLLEIEVLQALFGDEVQQELDIQVLSQVDVDAFTGIEIQEWPARIAEVAMWLMDHQMNIRLSEAFGQYFVRLPLRKSANIVLGNALRLDWKAVLPPEQCSYVLGNPPFIGKQFQDVSQKADMKLVWGKVKGAGVLDYVTCWYAKAADYIQDSAICVGFVSTNSISQGEQVGVLWNTLFQQNVKIHFAYRTFAWASEARGKAHVHVVIIGFGCFNPMRKRIYECDGDKVTCEEVENINPYLVEGNDVFPVSRSVPLCPVPNMMFGSMPNDGGNLLLSDKEAAALEKAYPAAAKWIRPFIGSEELINGCPRACLWLVDVSPHEIRNCSGVLKRVEAVRDKRSISTRAETQALAKTPALFGEIRQPTTRYLAIPKTSSERRAFIPIAFLGPDVIASTEIFTIPDATLYHFGILTSTMHMAWMRQVCGRLKSDYRYSAGLVYNNFPWPRLDLPLQEGDVRVREAASRIYWSSYHEGGEDENAFRPQPKPPTVRLIGDARKIAAVEAKAKAVLDVRARHPLATLADLYDPLTMPPDLVKAHADLDRAVDRCYRTAPFTSERQRVEFLFALYEHYTSPLLPATETRRKRSKARAVSSPSRKGKRF
ncbi:MAG: class I SAM-dependent DNA methyltransferase [Lentisphaerae bacterium]|nr:class I SAM-dependent DNA methyltransferase [Lentisphaerota bacterium]